MATNINSKIPVRNLLLSVIQNRFLKTSSTTSSSSSSFTVQFLVNSCGLPLQSALLISKKFQIDENKLQKPLSVIQFLKSHDFEDTHIAKMIEKWPAVLHSKIEVNLKPKFEFFIKNGFEGQLLPELAVLNPVIFKSSLDAHIKPCFELLKSFLESNDNVLATLKSSPFLFSFNFNSAVRPNIDLLKKEGVPFDRVAKLLMWHPRSIQQNNDRIVYAVSYLKNLGLEPENAMFVHALSVIVRMSESSWRKKIDVFKSVGWSEEEIFRAFKRFPYILACSEEKIRRMIDFFLNEMKLGKQTIVTYPVLLNYSFGNRVFPRWNVLQVLESKGLLIKTDTGICRLLSLTEKKFLQNYVIEYVDEIPDLLQIYGGTNK